jgi:hypothetical protein
LTQAAFNATHFNTTTAILQGGYRRFMKDFLAAAGPTIAVLMASGAFLALRSGSRREHVQTAIERCYQSVANDPDTMLALGRDLGALLDRT